MLFWKSSILKGLNIVLLHQQAQFHYQKKKKRDADMLTIYLHYFYISLDVQMEEKVDSYLGD